MILDTDFQHDHVTFTIPGKISQMLLERNYDPEKMISLASKVYRDELCKANKVPVRERKVCKPGILATLHKCGNSLNYNPHVHLVGTRELVNTETGEILKTNFISYKSFRFAWMNAVCKHLVREKILTKDDVQQIKQRYKNGFHVYFQPIKGNSNEVLFRTSEYIATGFFHNSQIIKVDHDSKKVTFRYKSWVDRNTGKKSYRVITMDIYQFIDKMLYFLPEPGRKMIRYYGIYAQSIRKKLELIRYTSWMQAIEHSFHTKPVNCPDCGEEMKYSVVYSGTVFREINKLRRTHDLQKGYFRLKKPP